MRISVSQFRSLLTILIHADSCRHNTNRLTGKTTAPETAKDKRNPRLIRMLLVYSAVFILFDTYSNVALAQSEVPNSGSNEVEDANPNVVQLPVSQFDPRDLIRPSVATPINATPVLRFQPTNTLKVDSRSFAMSFTRDGSRLIVGGNESSLTVWNTNSADVIKTLKMPSQGLSDLGMTDEGQLVATTRAGELYVYDMQTLEQVSKFEIETAFKSLSTFDNSVFTGSVDGIIHEWDLTRESPIAKSTSLQEPIIWLARTPDGSRTLAGTQSGRLGIWESLDEFPEVRKISQSPVLWVVIGPSGEDLAIVDRDGHVTIQNLKTRRKIWQLPIVDDWRHGPVSFSPDGAYLVATRVRRATDDTGSQGSVSEIDIYDTKTRRLAGRLLGQATPVDEIEISPLGDYVATSDRDGTIRLWRSSFRMIDDHRLRDRHADLTALIEKASSRGVDRARLYQERAFINARMQQFKSAAADFLEAKELEPDDTMHWMRAGVMLLMAEDTKAYREHTLEMLKRFEQTSNVYAAERTAKLCVLPVVPIGDPEIVSHLAEYATKNSEKSPWSMYFPMTEALVKYRYGEYDAALRLIDLSRTRKRPGQERPDIAEMIDHVVEALCWAAIGDNQRADAALKKADEYLLPFLERRIRVDDSSQHGWLIARMLYDEAKSLNRNQ